MKAIGHDLIKAYLDIYEEKYKKEYSAEYEAYVEKECDGGKYAVESWEGWIAAKAEHQILGDSYKTRLEVYCQSNGLIGWTDRLFSIATEGK